MVNERDKQYRRAVYFFGFLTIPVATVVATLVFIETHKSPYFEEMGGGIAAALVLLPSIAFVVLYVIVGAGCIVMAERTEKQRRR